MTHIKLNKSHYTTKFYNTATKQVIDCMAHFLLLDPATHNVFIISAGQYKVPGGGHYFAVVALQQHRGVTLQILGISWARVSVFIDCKKLVAPSFYIIYRVRVFVLKQRIYY